ncbi:unnamed protein product [Lota lota]
MVRSAWEPGLGSANQRPGIQRRTQGAGAYSHEYGRVCVTCSGPVEHRSSRAIGVPRRQQALRRSSGVYPGSPPVLQPGLRRIGPSKREPQTVPPRPRPRTRWFVVASRSLWRFRC